MNILDIAIDTEELENEDGSTSNIPSISITTGKDDY